jgi:ADP-heptose:LPS heptosyltransferase
MTIPLTSRPPRRIAVFRALFLGDLLCAIPALNALDRRFPDAQITLIGLPWAREFTARLPAIDRFVEFAGYPELPEVPPVEQRTAAFLEAIRGERYDLAIQLHGSGEVTNELVAAFGAKASIGFGPTGDRRLTLTLLWHEEEHEIARWLRLVSALGADGAGTEIEVPVFAKDVMRAESLLAAAGPGDGPIVGLHCGSKLESRRWPVERFAELGNELTRRYGARIVLTGGAGERHLAGAMCALLSAPPVDAVGRTDLGTFMALVGRLDLLVTNDTGASHIAAATRTKSIVLFGPSRPSRWAPLDGSRHAVVDARAVIDPAVAGELDETQYLRRLPVAPVLKACARMLATSRPPTPGVSERFDASMLEYA